MGTPTRQKAFVDDDSRMTTSEASEEGLGAMNARDEIREPPTALSPGASSRSLAMS